MTGILRKRLDRLMRGDDGAALVVTLALFMMMYISCAGVFAIGQTVKEKMILQNAADAAAYSAAIVQADTLSRIAALNREMALTYKSMVCRQMDYIVCRWLEDASRKYIDTHGVASLSGTPGHVTPEPSGTQQPSAEVKEGYYNARAEDLRAKFMGDSGLIAELNEAVSDLMGGYADRVKAAAEGVLRANLPDNYANDCYWHCKFQPPHDWMECLGGEDEEKFLRFVHKDRDEEWGDQYDEWFDVGIELRHLCVGQGYFRSGWLTRLGLQHRTVYNHDVPDVTAARPYVLAKDFYDNAGRRDGAISVGVAKYNRNPWARFVKTGFDGKKRGLYEFFQPLIGAIDWTWAVSSAQAGYIDSRDSTVIDERKESYREDRNYIADWKGDGDWNLRTDNWDAVYVPVCQSFASGDFASWIMGGWEVVSDNPSSDLPQYSLDAMTGTLPQMHNSGATSGTLVWGEFLDSMYH